jgi:predicted Zn-dependent protease
MISRDHAFRLLHEAMGYSKADKTFVMLTGGKNNLTRFANNIIHQNVMQKNYTVKVVSIVDGKVGIASGNVFHPDKLEEIVNNSYLIAKLQTKESEYIETTEKFEYGDLSIYDKKTAEFSEEDRANAVNEIISMCTKENLSAAGTFYTGDNLLTMLNSSGNFTYFSNSECGFTLTTTNDQDGTGYADDYAYKIQNLDYIEETKIAIEKAKKNRDRVILKPGYYTALLEPLCTTVFVDFLSYLGFGGQAFRYGNSFMCNKIGEKITGDNITIEDNCFYPYTMGFPFDFEGTTKKQVVLVENGIAKGVVHDNKTAKHFGVKSTGHALPLDSTMGPIPLHLRLKHGKSKYEDMIKSIEDGILVTQFFYDNVVDPMLPSITGMTRDGTFLIKNGEIVGACKNVRYNAEILKLFSNVKMIGNKYKSNMSGGTVTAAPAILVDGFHVSSSST